MYILAITLSDVELYAYGSCYYTHEWRKREEGIEIGTCVGHANRVKTRGDMVEERNKVQEVIKAKKQARKMGKHREGKRKMKAI